MFRRRTVGLALCLVMGISVLGRAQDNIVLTISVPQWHQQAYEAAYFDPFREANPGVDVVVVPAADNANPPSPAYASIDEHLEKVTAYVQSADVLYVTSWTLMPESTMAGLWLDLAPLISADPELDESGFYPPAWRAFQWDRGMWAMPTLLELDILTYNAAAFDESGFPYPDANWTINDFAERTVALTERDDDGNPVRLGCWCNTNLILYGLLGHGVADADGMPLLEDPELAALVEVWAKALTQIYPEGGYSSEGVPLMISGPWGLGSDRPDGMTMEIGELPGGIYGAQVSGFGISAGTASPELAFKLTKFLAENPINASSTFGAFSALRRATPEVRSNYSVNPIDILPVEQQEILQQAAETALTGSEFRYFDYVNQAIYQVNSEDLDASTALANAQLKALENRTAAANYTAPQVLTVATPIPTPSFSSDEVILKFGVSQWNLPNQADWERLAREFAEADPQVGVMQVNPQGDDYDAWAAESDCFLLNYNPVGIYSQGEYLALDPLLDADAAFNPDDLMPGALAALQFDEETFGYPLTVELSALTYNPEWFDQANVPLPELNWTVDQFTDALKQLAQNADADYVVPFAPRISENTDWLLLIAAYGGMPVDYRTNPPTWNFTAPETVDAIRQVLDLAKSGLIDYQELGTFSYTGMAKAGALNATMLSANSYFGGDVSATKYVNYPQGTQHAVMSIGSVGGGFITSDTQYVDACYRWISFVAAHPELLVNIMPARLSALDDPKVLTLQGESAVALYREYAALAADPTTVNIPSGFGGTIETYFVHQFLNNAFDAYMLENGDLEEALAEAQSKADAFDTCFRVIPPTTAESTTEEFEAGAQAIEDCVAQVDPDMAAERQELMQR